MENETNSNQFYILACDFNDIAISYRNTGDFHSSKYYLEIAKKHIDLAKEHFTKEKELQLEEISKNEKLSHKQIVKIIIFMNDIFYQIESLSLMINISLEESNYLNKFQPGANNC